MAFIELGKVSAHTIVLIGRLEVKARVSHISPKTSEIWGTHCAVALIRHEAVFLGGLKLVIHHSGDR